MIELPLIIENKFPKKSFPHIEYIFWVTILFFYNIFVPAFISILNIVKVFTF